MFIEHYLSNIIIAETENIYNVSDYSGIKGFDIFVGSSSLQGPYLVDTLFLFDFRLANT